MKAEKAIFKQFEENNQLKSSSKLDLLKDVKTHVKVVIGEADLTIDEIGKFTDGSLFPLNKDSSELYVDVLVDGYKVAKGEIVVVESEAYVKIIEIEGYNKKKEE